MKNGEKTAKAAKKTTKNGKKGWKNGETGKKRRKKAKNARKTAKRQKKLWGPPLTMKIILGAASKFFLALADLNNFLKYLCHKFFSRNRSTGFHE